MLEIARRYALTLPEAFEDHPWGETVIKVPVGSKPKIFAFLGVDGGRTGGAENDGGTGGAERGFSLGVKLPRSGMAALERPDAEPSGYGLGKSGWVSFHFVDLPEDAQLQAWILESYGAIAPRRLIKQLSPAHG